MEGGDPPPHDAAGLLRELRSVHELAARLDAPHRPAVVAARGAIEEAREQLRAGGVPDADLLARARALLAQLEQRSLRRVINATGVIVHTNLGRAPLPAAASEAVLEAASGYSNLELDLHPRERGSPHHPAAPPPPDLTGPDSPI